MSATERFRARRSRPSIVAPLVLILVVASLVGCAATPGLPSASTAGPSSTGAGPSSTGAGPSSMTAGPANTGAVGARASTFSEFRDGFCSAWTSVFTATGNPDLGWGSQLSLALEDAIARGDSSRIIETSSQIRAELERARTSAAYAAGWSPGAEVMTQTDRFVVALEAGVDALVASAALGKDAAVQARQEAFQKAGGIEAWYAMFAAAGPLASARPKDEPSRQCPAIPMSV